MPARRRQVQPEVRRSRTPGCRLGHTSGTPIAGRHRAGGRFVLVGLRLARRREQRRRTGGTGDGQIRRQVEMPQDPADDGDVLDERDEAQAAAAARTRQHIEAERAASSCCSSWWGWCSSGRMEAERL
jgi:hypothetical protein